MTTKLPQGVAVEIVDGFTIGVRHLLSDEKQKANGRAFTDNQLALRDQAIARAAFMAARAQHKMEVKDGVIQGENTLQRAMASMFAGGAPGTLFEYLSFDDYLQSEKFLKLIKGE